MGMIRSFFHPEDAYKGAQDYINRGYDESRGYQLPYFQQGQDEYGHLHDAINALLNPGELENKWASQYETSPYARDLLAANREEGLQDASSMGLMGSSAALGNIQRGAGQIVSADRRQFLEDLMNKYLQGIGLSQNLYGTGASVGQNLAKGAYEHGQDVGSLEFNRRRAPGELFGNLAGSGAAFALGGPQGLIYKMALQNANNKYNAPAYGGR